MTRLLLLEDDQTLGATLKERLELEGYQVSWAGSCRVAEEEFQKEKFDLIILDIGLPDGSGLEFAQKVRSVSSCPFIFVTAQTSAETRLEGFEIGAEEFIPKPFHLKEILLRIRHVLESHKPQGEIRVGKKRLDLNAMTLVHEDGRREFLQSRDFKILKMLVESSPRVVSRDEILNAIVGEEKFPSNRTVDNAIVRIRQLIGDEGADCIRSVRGVGYQWIQGSGS